MRSEITVLHLEEDRIEGKRLNDIPIGWIR